MKDLIINAFESALRQLNTLPELKKDLEKRPLSPPVKILAIGKSAFPMAKVCVDILKNREINYSGYLLTKYGNVSGIIPNLIVREASHPIPDINTIKYSREILSWLQELHANEELIILLSGGGSSLFEVPINGFTLEDLIAFNKNLLQSGLNIKEMNYERAKKSKVKAGKALNYIKAMKIYCYALSDVPDNEPEIIASGCFFPANSQKIEDNYYQAKLKKGKQELYYSIIGDNFSLRYQLAKELPPPVYVQPRYFSENVENVAEFIADFAFSTDKKGMYIFGGEAPVKVTGNGIGGRCTHLALLLAKKIAGKKHITFYALASDGNDNLENVSGACVNQNTLNQLQAKGIDISSVIAKCDSYSALKTINAVVPAFQNPLNLNDIYLLQLY
jgi:hydroxypyruvate reductase